MGATRLKIIWTGQQKAGTVSVTKKKQLEEHCATNYVNWQQVSNMIGYKKSILERQSLSEVKMGLCTPICEKLQLQFVEQFQNNAPQCKIVKAMNISSSTAHHIMKKFRIWRNLWPESLSINLK